MFLKIKRICARPKFLYQFYHTLKNRIGLLLRLWAWFVFNTQRFLFFRSLSDFLKSAVRLLQETNGFRHFRAHSLLLVLWRGLNITVFSIVTECIFRIYFSKFIFNLNNTQDLWVLWRNCAGKCSLKKCVKIRLLICLADKNSLLF